MMTKKTRKIIRIDEDKCDGCGQCLPGCPEGALQIVDGKARLVKESFCDGLGACLGHCPQDALHVEEREADEYDARGVLKHLEKQSPELAEKHKEHMRAHGLEEPDSDAEDMPACPAGQVSCWDENSGAGKEEQAGTAASSSGLGHWPVKLNLIPPHAEFLKNADLMLMADCVPFACATVHRDFLPGNAVAAGCPKFDDTGAYVDKIAQMLESVNLNSITVVYMEIPCCRGFVGLVKKAVQKSGVDMPLETVQIGIKGEVIKREAFEV